MSEHLNATQQNEKFDFAKFGSNFESDQSMVVGTFGRRAFRPNDQSAKDAPGASPELGNSLAFGYRRLAPTCSAGTLVSLVPCLSDAL